eukprot:6512832-Pyramimonas_sp.AAC.1
MPEYKHVVLQDVKAHGGCLHAFPGVASIEEMSSSAVARDDAEDADWSAWSSGGTWSARQEDDGATAADSWTSSATWTWAGSHHEVGATSEPCRVSWGSRSSASDGAQNRADGWGWPGRSAAGDRSWTPQSWSHQERGWSAGGSAEEDWWTSGSRGQRERNDFQESSDATRGW